MLNIIYSRCEECPGRENLRDHLYNSTEDCEDSQIMYQQWVGTERTTLSSDTTSLHNLIGNVVTSIDELTSHSYIAKAQSKYLKTRKENLDNTTVILLCDFAENFTFVIQDEYRVIIGLRTRQQSILSLCITKLMIRSCINHSVLYLTNYTMIQQWSIPSKRCS